MLAKDVEQRYQSARSFADALQRILEGKPQKLSELLGKKLTVVCFFRGELPLAAWELSDLEIEVAQRYAIDRDTLTL